MGEMYAPHGTSEVQHMGLKQRLGDAEPVEVESPEPVYELPSPELHR